MWLTHGYEWVNYGLLSKCIEVGECSDKRKRTVVNEDDCANE